MIKTNGNFKCNINLLNSFNLDGLKNPKYQEMLLC